MTNFLYKFAHKLEKIRRETEKKKTEQLKKLEAFQESITDDFDQKIKNLSKKKKTLQENIFGKPEKTNHKERLNKLQELRRSLLSEFDKNIEKLTEKRDLIREAIKEKIKLKRFKIGVFRTIFPVQFRMLLSIPFIYGMFIPTVILHLFLELYHQICFSLYKIPKVKAKEYFIFDRAHLPYLNTLEKINCAYCSYFNCLIAYAQEIGGRTERYWCPIKHANKVKNKHSQYDLFFDYLEAEEYREKLKEIRKFQDMKQIKKLKQPKSRKS